jgi:hypothetical protein
MAWNLYTKSWAAAKATKSAQLPSIVVCDPSDASIAAFVKNVEKESGGEAASRVKRVETPFE